MRHALAQCRRPSHLNAARLEVGQHLRARTSREALEGREDTSPEGRRVSPPRNVCLPVSFDDVEEWFIRDATPVGEHALKGANLLVDRRAGAFQDGEFVPEFSGDLNA